MDMLERVGGEAAVQEFELDEGCWGWRGTMEFQPELLVAVVETDEGLRAVNELRDWSGVMLRMGLKEAVEEVAKFVGGAGLGVDQENIGGCAGEDCTRWGSGLELPLIMSEAPFELWPRIRRSKSSSPTLA